MTQGVLNFESKTSGIRGKQQELDKLAHGTSIKALVYQILQEAQIPLLESDFVRILWDGYERRALGSSVSRHLRYLQNDGFVVGKCVVINDVRKTWKEWTKKEQINV